MQKPVKKRDNLGKLSKRGLKSVTVPKDRDTINRLVK